jgi:hypothetical protein
MKSFRRIALVLAGHAVAFGPLAAQAALAQVQTIDPNSAIDADLNRGAASPAAQPRSVMDGPAQGAAQATPVGPEAEQLPPVSQSPTAPASLPPAGAAAVPPPASSATGATAGQTYKEDDLIGAAEGVFGKGSRGLALMIQDILKKQGEPNAYITGREGGGAVVVGLRYGSGTLHHKVEGDMPVYWTGPSLGFDFGANASNTFVLVYNLYDTQDLYQRFGAGEGQAYLVGGFNVSYLRRGDVVLIPVRMGAGLRLGLNAGYMKFSHKQKWMPF